MRAGARLSTHNQQAQAEQWRLLRDEVRGRQRTVEVEHEAAALSDARPTMWLPPLNAFGEVVESDGWHEVEE